MSKVDSLMVSSVPDLPGEARYVLEDDRIELSPLQGGRALELTEVELSPSRLSFRLPGESVARVWDRVE